MQIKNEKNRGKKKTATPSKRVSSDTTQFWLHLILDRAPASKTPQTLLQSSLARQNRVITNAMIAATTLPPAMAATRPAVSTLTFVKGPISALVAIRRDTRRGSEAATGGGAIICGRCTRGLAVGAPAARYVRGHVRVDAGDRRVCGERRGVHSDGAKAEQAIFVWGDGASGARAIGGAEGSGESSA